MMPRAIEQLMTSQPPPPQLKRWTKSEYGRLLEHFREQRVYLFRGELIEMPPQYHPHGYAVMKLNQALCKAFALDAGFEFRVQLPFDAPGESMPEPDLLVCTAAQGLRKPHPNEALLVVEVADSSLDRDRAKALEYAAAGIPEYWIVDVNNRRVELHRSPVSDNATELGFRYSSIKLVEKIDCIEPISKPGSPISLAPIFA